MFKEEDKLSSRCRWLAKEKTDIKRGQAQYDVALSLKGAPLALMGLSFQQQNLYWKVMQQHIYIAPL